MLDLKGQTIYIGLVNGLDGKVGGTAVEALTPTLDQEQAVVWVVGLP